MERLFNVPNKREERFVIRLILICATLGRRRKHYAIHKNVWGRKPLVMPLNSTQDN
jgi:hypothetical protein